MVHILHLIAHSDEISIFDAVEDMKRAISRQFEEDKHLDEFLKLMDRAIALSKDGGIDDLEAIKKLGQGWVAEEALAIAIYCSLKYSNDFDKALIASVNHSGDSDSTGAITGNIVGAYLGLKGIPQKYLNNLDILRQHFPLSEKIQQKLSEASADMRSRSHHKFCLRSAALKIK